MKRFSPKFTEHLSLDIIWYPTLFQTIRFSFDGTRINESDTPKSLDMEDGDTIEVFQQQSGGGTFNNIVTSKC